MGLRQYTNASRVPQTEEEKLAAMAEAFGINQAPTEQDIAQQPVNIPEQNVNMAALGETGPEISAQDVMDENGPQATQADMIAKYIEEQRAAGAPALARQNAGLAELKSKIKGYENQKTGVNLAPLLNWADSFSGGNSAQGYKAPITQEEKLAKIADLYKGYQGELDKATQQQLAQGQNKLLGQSMMAQMKGGQADQRLQNRIDFQAHKSVVGAIKSDPTQKAYLTQLKNLDNAASIVANAKSLTPQQIDEFQQSVRSNLGIKGTSGVGEREKTMLDSMGLRGERWVQFLSGTPAEISKNDALVKHIQDLAQVESRNIKDQMKNRLDVLSEGYGSMYERRPELRKDLNNLLKSTEKQFETKSLGEAVAPQQATQPSQSDIQAELKRRGLVK